MKNKIIPSEFFIARFKKLRRKFPSLAEDIIQLEKLLFENPMLGTSLGANLYKIRLASKSKGGGKSGGFRVVTFLLEESKNGFIVFLVTIYDKSSESSIHKKDLLEIVKGIDK
jgi:mRNA-degrading endonuclease RelE of RelBE toxin-antitoxin system